MDAPLPSVRVGLQQLTLLLIGHVLAWPMFRFLFRLRIERDPHWNRCDACILASNHRSFIDPILVSMLSRRPVSFFARLNLWHNPVIRWCLETLGGFPVDREAPALGTMKDVVRALRAGSRVLIFPEGTRTRDGRLGILRQGPALFARRGGVAVVPVYLHRSETGWPRGWPFISPHGKIRIRLGRPVAVPAGLSGKEADDWTTRYLQHWMQRQERALGR